MRRLFLLILGPMLFCLGCAESGPSRKTAFTSVDRQVAFAPQAPPAEQAIAPGTGNVVSGLVATQPPAQPGGGDPPAKKGGKLEPPAERKMKYTADIKLICEDLPKAEEGLKTALKKYKGIVALSEVSGTPGVPRSGSWRLRVPVAGFEDFREAVLKLGEHEKNTSKADDVTDEYYDLENHIKNKLVEEESLRKLLEKSGDNLQNILLLRDKLADIRDYINRQEGKLRVLANLTDLTTITLTIREKQKYDPTPPPEIAEAPTFGMRVSRTFNASWDAFVGFVQMVILAIIAAGHWVALLIVVAAPVVLLARRWKRAQPIVVELAQPSPPPSA